MNRRQFSGTVLTSLLSLSAGELSLAAGANPKSKVSWQKTLRAAKEAAIEQNKPLMLVFGASWCTFCHKLHRETFTDRNLAALIDREFIAVTQDFDKDTRVVEILEVEKLPCTIVLSPEADLLLKFVGFAKPVEFQKKLESALTRREEIQLLQATETRKSR